MDSNPDSDHLSHVDCDPDSNLDSGPGHGARVNAAFDTMRWRYEYYISKREKKDRDRRARGVKRKEIERTLRSCACHSSITRRAYSL